MLKFRSLSIIAFVCGASFSYYIHSDIYSSVAKTSPDGFIVDTINRIRQFTAEETGGDNDFDGIDTSGIELVSEQPPKLRLQQNMEVTRVFSSEWTDDNWNLGVLNTKVLDKFPDIDAILQLSPPDPLDSNDQDWYKFAIQLIDTPTAKRHRSIYISPLLIWYVYIAKHNPKTIYDLFNNDQLSIAAYGHLIQFGFLDDWWEHTDEFNSLIMENGEALLSIIFSEGEAEARMIYIRSFFEIVKTQKTFRIDVDNFVFALEAMNQAQKRDALDLFKIKKITIDPRHVELLTQTEHWQISDHDILSLIQINSFKHSDRMMSSYFTGAAKYGDDKYFNLLLNDAPHNDSQPKNFYCSACALALISDGVLGTPLIEQVNKRGKLYFSYNPERKEYVVAITRSGVLN